MIAVPIPDDLLDALAARVGVLIKEQRSLLSTEGLAAYYGVKERTIKTWRQEGMPSLRIGHSTVLHDVAATDAWLRGRAA